MVLHGIVRKFSEMKVLTAKPKSNTLQLSIHDPQDFYTCGDTINGELLLTVSDRTLRLSRMLVCIECIETCNMSTVGLRKTERFKQSRYTLELTAKIGESISRGSYKIPFDYMLPDACNRYPPSESLEALGDSVSGIRWYLQAVVELTNNTKVPEQPITLLEATKIYFYPAMSHLELSLGNRIGSNHAKLDNLEVFLKTPLKLPQSPNFWPLEIRMVPDIPMIIESVTLSLKKRVVFWCDEDAQVITKTEQIASFEYGELVTKELELNGLTQKWRLSKIATPKFSSLTMNVSYALILSVLGPRRRKYAFPGMDFVSPSIEHGKEKQSPFQSDADEVPPPLYTRN